MTRLALLMGLVAVLAACVIGDAPAVTDDARRVQTLPDTLALPYLPLDAFLRPPPDRGRFNTLGKVSGWMTCPPCPPGAMCEPCAPFAVRLDAPAPGGQASAWLELPNDVFEDTTLLDRGRIYAVSVHVEARQSALYADPKFGRDSLQYVRLIGLGFTRSERSDLLPLKHP